MSLKDITHLIQSFGYPSLKIANYQEYLEAGLYGSIRNSNLIQSDLSAAGPSTFSIIFTLETKGFGGRFLRTEGGKAVEDSENLLMAIANLDFAQQM
jgi:hypothetical protein